MRGDACIVCGNTSKKEPKLSFHRFPKDVEKRAKWLKVFGLSESQLKSHSQVYSRHFRDFHNVYNGCGSGSHRRHFSVFGLIVSWLLAVAP